MSRSARFLPVCDDLIRVDIKIHDKRKISAVQVARAVPVPRLGLTGFVAAAALVSLAWLLTFRLNDWAFDMLKLSPHVCWIFLPAGVRLLAVLLFDWAGVAGLFVGCLVGLGTVYGDNLPAALVLAGLSALGPLVALRLTRRWLKLPFDFSGLSPRHLATFSSVGALLNVVPSTIFHRLTDQPLTAFDHALPMFIGDAAGSLLLFYGLAGLARLGLRLAR